LGTRSQPREARGKMAEVTVLYALASELHAVQAARALRELGAMEPADGGRAGKISASTNAFVVHPSPEQVTSERGNAMSVAWITAQAVFESFPFEIEDLRFFVRQPIPRSGKYMWLLVQTPFEQIEVQDGVVQMQVVRRNEFPCLAADPEGDVWWMASENDPVDSSSSKTTSTVNIDSGSASWQQNQDQRRERNSSRSRAAMAEAAANAAANAASKLSDRLSGMNMQDTFQKTSQGVASNLGKFASWAKKGIAAASDAIQNNETIQFQSKSVEIRKKIADGGFSEVFLAQDPQSGKELALKRCLAQTREDVSALKLEVSVHQKTRSAYVMQLVDFMETESRRVPGAREFYLLFPLYSGGSVFDQMESASQNPGLEWPYPEPIAAGLMAGVLEGLAALHEAGFTHRDIKPHNVLLEVRGGGPAQLPQDYRNIRPILMDLGSCGPLNAIVSTRNEARLAIDEATVKCSAPYRAPELFEVPELPYEYGPALDVWSIGTTLFAMTYGRMWSPFEHPTQGVQTLAILQANVRYPSTTKSLYSEDFMKIVKQSLRLDASKRPSVETMRKQLAKLAA